MTINSINSAELYVRHFINTSYERFGIIRPSNHNSSGSVAGDFYTFVDHYGDEWSKIIGSGKIFGATFYGFLVLDEHFWEEGVFVVQVPNQHLLLTDVTVTARTYDYRRISVYYKNLVPISNELVSGIHKQLSARDDFSGLEFSKTSGDSNKMNDIEYSLSRLGSTGGNDGTIALASSLKALAPKSSLTIESNSVEKDMSNFDKVISKNKDAIKLAAKLEVGNAATNILASKIKTQLPMMMQGYAEHPLFKVVVGNAASAAITHFAPTNKKATIIGDAMVAAAMQQFVQSFDMPKLIEDLINGVNLAALVEDQE